MNQITHRWIKRFQLSIFRDLDISYLLRVRHNGCWLASGGSDDCCLDSVRWRKKENKGFKFPFLGFPNPLLSDLWFFLKKKHSKRSRFVVFFFFFKFVQHRNWDEPADRRFSQFFPVFYRFSNFSTGSLPRRLTTSSRPDRCPIPGSTDRSSFNYIVKNHVRVCLF